MTNNSFFVEQEIPSLIKATIVKKYFFAWAKIMLSQPHVKKIAYIDLFSGPGRYMDGAESTPLMILTMAIKDPNLCKSLVAIFNDIDKNNVEKLSQSIAGLNGVKNLKYQPQIFNQEVDIEFAEFFSKKNLIPTFFFIDPFGYKGLSLKLVNSVLKDWGSDCVFFFNYNRINMGVNNNIVETHMKALFGEERKLQLVKKLAEIHSPSEREAQIVEDLSSALKEMGGGKFVLPFRFRNETGARTSHYLIFVTKSFLGYEIMKDIMAGMSLQEQNGIASFEYSPATERQPQLFALQRTVDELEPILMQLFKGKKLTLQEIYEQHSVGTPYVRKNYRKVLSDLADNEKITTERRNGAPRRKGTFPEDLIACFPE